MLQFGSKHVCIEDVYIFKHCREMTLFLLWIETYCISCVVQQTSGEKDLSSLVRDDDSSLAAIRHVQSIIPVVRPRPNIRSHSVLLRHTDEPQRGRNSCLWLQSRSVLSSFGVALMSCRDNFHVVRSAFNMSTFPVHVDTMRLIMTQNRSPRTEPRS